MANIQNIKNGETGLSVRNKLNALIAKAQDTSGSLNILSASFENFSASYVADSGSFDSRIKGISGSVEILSGSFEEFSGSYLIDSASFSQRITNNSASISVLSGSFVDFSASYVIDSGSIAGRVTNNSASIATLSASFEEFSGSYVIDSGSIAGRITDNSASIALLSSSFLEFSASYNSGSFSGSFHGDGKRVTGVVSSSYAISSSYTVSSSYALSASVAESSSYALTSSYAHTASVLNWEGNQFEIHVDPNMGEDVPDAGTLLKPFKTINYAISQPPTNGYRLILHRGIYVEDVTITEANVSIVGYEAGNGALIEIQGGLSVEVAVPASTRLSSIRVNNLIHQSTGGLYLNDVTVLNQATFNGVYAEISDCRMECSSGINITTVGTVFVQNSIFYPVTVNNSAAIVYLKNLISTVQPTVTAGTLAIVDSLVYPAVSGQPAITSAVGSTVSLLNSQVLNAAGIPQRVNIEGVFTYSNSIFDRDNSVLGTVVDTTAEFTDLHAKTLDVSGSATIGGDVVINGKLTAREFNTQLVNSSIIYQSGSTKFGDTSDDTHKFTGSLFITGSLVVNSVQIASASIASGSIASASFATTASYAQLANQAHTSSLSNQSKTVYVNGDNSNVNYGILFNYDNIEDGYSRVGVDAGSDFSYNPANNTLIVQYVDGIAASASYVQAQNIKGTIDISDQTNLAAGTNINLVNDTVNLNENISVTTVTASFKGDVDGNAKTATSASYALTASYALNGGGAGSAVTASYAISASYAHTASYVATASNAISASYALSASHAITASFAESASYTISSSVADFAVTASYVPSSSYAVRAQYATSASYADGAYVNFLSSGSGAIVQTSADIWESEMIRLDLENQTNPGRLVIGGSARNSYRTYYFPDEQTFPANINQNAYGISKYGTIKVGANAQGALPLGNEDNGIPYINGVLDIAGTAGPNKRTPFGLGRAATIRDVVNSQGEFSFIHWGGDDGTGQRYEMTFSGGNKLRLVPAYYANNASIYNEIYQTNQSEAATSVLNYDSATRPWGYWSSRINQIFQWRVVRSGSNLVSQVRCNGSQNWVTIRTIAATTFQGMWNADVTVNNWWAWQFSKGFAWSTSTNTFDNLYVKMSQSEFPMNI